jgi:hypothetical protein
MDDEAKYGRCGGIKRSMRQSRDRKDKRRDGGGKKLGNEKLGGETC